jgi:hypothetical protein
MKHFLYVPFTGLGLYGGFRGNRWLRNRIEVFKQFVVPSMLAQTNQNFVVWVGWRREEQDNKYVGELRTYLENTFGADRVVFTFGGLCFWDDKYEDDVAHQRLIMALHHSLKELIDWVGDVKDVLMTIQPSDDCYKNTMVENMQNLFSRSDYGAAGYTKGYLMNYQTGELKEYNPKTNPPFFTIRFPKNVFIDPLKHAKHTGPYKSHEYIPQHMKYASIDERGFIVGTHGENVSTHFNHPYGGADIPKEMLSEFGLGLVEPIKIRYSIRKQIMRRLPYRVQRKLRYIFGEKLYSKLYNFLRN